MKLYVVTDGEYSDYTVRGIYSTKRKAEYAKKLFAASNDIYEEDLDALPEHPHNQFCWHVAMDELGNSTVVERENVQWRVKDEWRPYGDDKRVSFYMWARDEQHAVKIANERRIMLLASGEWTTDWDLWKKGLK